MSTTTIAIAAIAALSYFGDFFLGQPGGPFLMMTFGVAAVLLPGFVDEVAEFVLFKPDVTAAADPLDPQAKTVAGGVKAAMNLCAFEGVDVKLLVAFVPGSVVELGLNSVRRRCFAEVFRQGAVQKSQAALPAFTAGASPSWFRFEAAGSGGVRLLFKPPHGSGARLECSVFRTPFFWPVAAMFILAAVAVWVAGAKALAGVLPCAAAGLLLACRRRCASPAVKSRRVSRPEWALRITFCAFVAMEFYREGLL